MMFVLLIAAFISFASAKNVSLNGKSCGLSNVFKESVNFIVKTGFRPLPKGSCRKAEIKLCQTPTERQRKAERMPKECKPLITSNITPYNPTKPNK